MSYYFSVYLPDIIVTFLHPPTPLHPCSWFSEVAKILPDSFKRNFKDPWRRPHMLMKEEKARWGLYYQTANKHTQNMLTADPATRPTLISSLELAFMCNQRREGVITAGLCKVLKDHVSGTAWRLRFCGEKKMLSEYFAWNLQAIFIPSLNAQLLVMYAIIINKMFHCVASSYFLIIQETCRC